MAIDVRRIGHAAMETIEGLEKMYGEDAWLEALVICASVLPGEPGRVGIGGGG